MYFLLLIFGCRFSLVHGGLRFCFGSKIKKETEVGRRREIEKNNKKIKKIGFRRGGAAAPAGQPLPELPSPSPVSGQQGRTPPCFFMRERRELRVVLW